MDDEQIAVAIAEYRKEIGSLKHRMTAVEQTQKEISQIARNTDKLAYSVESMVKEQAEQGKRLERLEQAPLEDYKHYKRLIIGTLISGIIGALLGAVFVIILKS